MRENSDRGTEKKGRSRVYSAVLSLVFPGLGQMVRGRIFAGLLFFANVVLYFVPLFVTHTVEYRRADSIFAHRSGCVGLLGSGRISLSQFLPGDGTSRIPPLFRRRILRRVLCPPPPRHLKRLETFTQSESQ